MRPKRRHGKSGKHKQPQRQLRAPPAFWKLVELALAQSRLPWSDWARQHLAIAAAQSVGGDVPAALRTTKPESD